MRRLTNVLNYVTYSKDYMFTLLSRLKARQKQN